LLFLWAQVILTPLDCVAPIWAGAWEVVGMVLVSETNDAPTLPFHGAEVVGCLAVFVKVTQYLAVTTGMATAMASKASWFNTHGGGRASSEVVGLYLVELALLLTELWVLPYKGPEAA
jgi:hypothetical protein